MSSTDTRIRRREPQGMDFSTIPARTPAPVEQPAEDQHWLRDLFQTQASSWVVSVGVHLGILLILGFFVLRVTKEVPVVTVLEVDAAEIEFDEGETLGDGGDLMDSLVGGEQTTTELPGSEGFATAPVVGLAEMDLPPLNLGVSSEFGMIAQAGGGGGTGGDPGRIGEIDRRVAAGGGGTGGALRVSLAWENMNDLDLHVLTPDGEHISYQQKNSECGGELDIDTNAITPTTAQAVENVVWSATPRDGTYEVQVHFFMQHANQPAATSCDILFVIGDQKRFLTIRGLREKQWAEVAIIQIENGALVEFTPGDRAREGEPSDTDAGPVEDDHREAQRQQSAQQALNEAMEVENPEGRANRLRRVIERFPGTPAADEAQLRINEIEAM